MGKQSSDISGRALGRSASGLAAFALALAVWPAAGGAAPRGAASTVIRRPVLHQLQSPEVILPDFEPKLDSPPGKIRVGDELNLRLEGPAAADTVKKLEPAEGEKPLIDQGWQLYGLESGGFLLVPLKAGSVTLPPLDAKDADGKTVGKTRPLALTVESAIRPDDPAPQEPVEAKPPVRLAFPLAFAIALGAAALIVLSGVGYVIYRAIRAAREKAARRPAGPPPPEDVVALRAFDELERSQALAQGKPKIHYFGVSEILKRYLGARYRIDAAESTSHELIGLMRDGHAVSDDLLRRLQELFEKLDLVKFTDHVPEARDGLNALEEARAIVLVTRRLPTVASQAAGGPNAV